MDKRLVLKPKIICPGNARVHGLRVAGRRNALGSVLSRRRCRWRSGAARAMAAFLRHNTHTGPNYRVPLLQQTHDPECKHDCLSKHSLETMVRAAQRAQRNTTGYYTGYIQKRQPVGKFELRQASMNLRFLANTIKHRSNRQQYHHVANRMLGDLEFRGHARPAIEEFNLAANHDSSDVTKAEFLRTFATDTFLGAELLRREEQLHKLNASSAGAPAAQRRHTEETEEKFVHCTSATHDQDDAQQKTQSADAIVAANSCRDRISQDEAMHVLSSIRLAQPLKEFVPRISTQISFTDKYGYRGTAPELYYLSPWEFTKWWACELLRTPDWYRKHKRPPLTQWTPAGAPYVAALCAGARTGSMPAAKPGVHYRLIEPVPQENHIAFPDMLATQGVRHRWILIRKARPDVPTPHRTSLLRKHMSETTKSRILSIYLRPWTLGFEVLVLGQDGSQELS